MTYRNFREDPRVLKKSPPDLTLGLEPSKPGSKRPKTALSAPERRSEKGAKEFFNRLTPYRKVGE
jgi:hypothetical protein